MRALLSVALLLPLALTGCSDDDSPGDGAGQPEAPARTFAQALANATVPAFSWDVEGGIDWWEVLSTTYVKRDALTPNNDGAAQFIEQSLAAAGLETQIIHYVPGVGPVPTSEAPVGAGIHVVVGMKRGTTDPDHAIALGGHYDTQQATVQGAYDNGAGTAMVYNVCRTLAQVPMDKTLLCLFFDGEEEGILGSGAYVESPPADHPEIDFYFGYDMTGINWPGYPDWKLYSWIQADYATSLFPLVNATFNEVLQWPAAGVEAFPFNDRNSDEAAFIGAGIPAIRFAGGRTAGAYPEYHMPGDTVEFVYEFVGGRENFAAGFGATVQASFNLALMLDDTSIPELEEVYSP